MNSCQTISEMPAETALCNEVLPYCYDKALNQDETDVDCGGMICDKCGLGKACFRNDDCLSSCISGKCAFEAGQQPAPASDYSLVLKVTGAIFIIAIIFVAFALIKKTGVFRMLKNASIFDMKKLKKQKIIILTDKREQVKEEIKIFSKKEHMDTKKKKTRFNRFAENVNGYLKNIGSDSGSTIKEKPQKGLLNKNPSKVQAHPAKDFVLSSLREVYNE